MNVAFRVDAGPRVGTGHFMRCLCLADHLRSTGATIRFLTRPLPPYLHQTLAERAYEVSTLDAATSVDDLEGARLALDGLAWDWLVVDHYGLDHRWEVGLRGSAKRILAIDDLANRAHDCDLLLDQNVSADMARRYDGRVPQHCQVLLGPRYALLREEFRQARRAVAPRTGAVTRAFISFGGTDDANWTAVAIDALVAAPADVGKVDVVIGAAHGHRRDIEAACRQFGFACHVQPPQISSLMAAADLAIGAGGITMWERCCLGVPALTVAIAANQESAVRASARRGLVYSPAGEAAAAPSLAGHVAALIENPFLREMLSHNGMEAVDGKGTARVARAMGADAICVREATASDAAALFAWRNHGSVRVFARHTEPIAPADHQAWLRAVLADPDRVLLIGERHGRAVGVVRFDIAKTVAEVSIYRVPDVPDRGIGAPLMRAAEERLLVLKPHVTSIKAEVVGDNESSHQMLRDAGYHRRATVWEKHIRS